MKKIQLYINTNVKKCGELKTKCGILSDRQLKNILVDEESYNKFNF